MIKADNRLPRYQQLRDDFMSRLARQEWQAGEMIPSETELALQYKMSVGTVRKAVDLLVQDGLLDRQHGRGTFVCRPRFSSTMFRFFRFRTKGNEQQVPESRILERLRLPAPTDVADALRLREGAPVIFLRRLRVVSGKPLLAEEIWLDHRRFEPLLSIEPSRFGDLLYPLYEERCGQVVASADEVLSVEAGAAPYSTMLELDEAEPLILIERTAMDLERTPLEWRRSRGPAHLFKYRIEIK